MSRKRMLIGGTLLTVVVAFLALKWRFDVGQVEDSNGIADMWLLDFSNGMRPSIVDVDDTLRRCETEIASVKALWFVSNSEKAKVLEKLSKYRQLIEDWKTRMREERSKNPYR